MRRTTHLMLGAAAGSLVAASASLPIAAGAIWLGVAGGGYPDWLDLRSELKGALRLRHRGASHGIPVAIIATGIVYLAPTSLASSVVDAPVWLKPEHRSVEIWTLAFAAGIATHLASDACTHAGIRPLLPFSRWRMWLLPRVLRSRSDGLLNTVLLGLSFAMLGLMLLVAVGQESGIL